MLPSVARWDGCGRSVAVADRVLAHSTELAGFDRASFVHGAVAVGDLLQRECLVDDFAGLILPLSIRAISPGM
jgi:hypothetical protein